MSDFFSRIINKFKLILPSKPEKTFSDIYKRNQWGSGESVSGPGSTFSATETVRAAIPEVLKKYHIKSMLDAPCGDCNWISHVDFGDIEYTGADIVAELIEKNKRHFPDKKFTKLDIIKDKIPATDLILCRDCFIHLRNTDVNRVMNNFRKSCSTYLLASTYPVETNKQILTGHYRPVNLFKPPYNLADALELIPDFAADGTERYLGLWNLKEI